MDFDKLDSIESIYYN